MHGWWFLQMCISQPDTRVRVGRIPHPLVLARA